MTRCDKINLSKRCCYDIVDYSSNQLYSAVTIFPIAMTTSLYSIELPDDQLPMVQVFANAKKKELSNIDSRQVVDLFKVHGAILFRDFDFDLSAFAKFTDQFCDSYIRNESPGRESLDDDGRIQTVNLGERHFPLHPELSREPWQPDIAWFNCEQAATMQGETTVCDGIAAAKAFSPSLFAHLKESTLAHTIPATLEWCTNYLGNPDLRIDEVERYSTPAMQFKLKNGEITRTYLRPMLHKPMFSDQWAYGNFLVFARKQLRVSYFPTYANGEEIPDGIVDEIEQVTNGLASDIKWQKGDLVMLDNTRFMHGRNPIGDPQNRRIYTQFGYASFS